MMTASLPQPFESPVDEPEAPSGDEAREEPIALPTPKAPRGTGKASPAASAPRAPLATSPRAKTTSENADSAEPARKPAARKPTAARKPAARKPAVPRTTASSRTSTTPARTKPKSATPKDAAIADETSHDESSPSGVAESAAAETSAPRKTSSPRKPAAARKPATPSKPATPRKATAPRASAKKPPADPAAPSPSLAGAAAEDLVIPPKPPLPQASEAEPDREDTAPEAAEIEESPAGESLGSADETSEERPNEAEAEAEEPETWVQESAKADADALETLASVDDASLDAGRLDATAALTLVDSEEHGEASGVEEPLALSLRAVSKSFGGTRAVDGIDLTVPAGSFYGLVGPNGAGKTTTLSMIAGLLRPDEGEVTIGGVDAARDGAAAKSMMGVLPDRLRTFDRLTGRQLLYYYGVLRGLPSAVVESRTADLARAFDLVGALGRPVSDYSAGMTKKVMLAGAMIHSPRLLVLDEPFEAVDPVSSSVILDILGTYVSHGGTVILSSHGMELVERVCSRVAILVAGRVLAEGTIDEVRGGSTLEERFIELSGGLGDVEGLEWLYTFSD